MKRELPLPSALERKMLGDAARQGKILKQVKRVRKNSGAVIATVPKAHQRISVARKWVLAGGGFFEIPPDAWKGEWNLEVLAENIKEEPAKTHPTDSWVQEYKRKAGLS